MFSNLFERRNKTVSHLVKLGDCIGRSLRENVMLFSVESDGKHVTYLTESDKVISGYFDIDENIKLSDIRVQSVDVYKNPEVFDEFVNEKVSGLVSHIFNTEYGGADHTFSDIMSLWENRLKIDSIQGKLASKKEKLSEAESILTTSQFQNLVEITPQLVEFLKESYDKVSTVPEIRNAVNLSTTISKAFDFPRIDIETLEKGGSYTLKEGTTESVYEMICRQELVKKEILESKRNFDSVWASNKTIKDLAGLVHESDDTKVAMTLVEAIQEIPYLAMASKKSMTEAFTKCLSRVGGIVSEADIKKHSSRIFELKKDIRTDIKEALNTKYGINIANLKESISFTSLANTQVVILEALSRLAPASSVLKKTLSEAADALKGKNGVESIDVNDYICSVLTDAGYSELIEAANADNDTSSFKRLSEDSVNKSALTNLIVEKKKKVDGDEQYASDETQEDDSTGEEEEEKDGKKKKKKVEKKEDEKKEDEEAPDDEEEDLKESEDASDPIDSTEDIVSELSDMDDIVDNIISSHKKD